jgi:HPr kinase/phosphorylase
LHRRQLDWRSSLTLPGAFVEVFSLGVLLAGPSGAGKSELALDLVSRGQRLIADDAVEILRPCANLLVGRCPELLRDFLELRGLGVINVRRMYGDGALAPMQRLDLVVRLEQTAAPAADEGADRLSGRRGSRDILGVAVPEIFLKAGLGHNQRALVEAACRDHWLRLFGYRADEDMIERQRTALRKDI